MPLTIPDPVLVLLVGPSGAGKSTFARRHFAATEVVSSDAARALVSDDPADQGASAEAFQILALIVKGRLRRRRTTVVDATNLRATDRRRYLAVARRNGVPTVAVAFDFAPALYAAHNQRRPDRVVDQHVVDDQAARMTAALAALPAEGYAAVYVLASPAEALTAQVVREATP